MKSDKNIYVIQSLPTLEPNSVMLMTANIWSIDEGEIRAGNISLSRQI